MPINKIEMTGFRNHNNRSFNFKPGINVIWGENGSGKTSILEAIHILSTGRSFKTNRLVETVKYDSEYFRINGFFTTNEKENQITFTQTKDKRKKIKNNNAPVSVKEIIGLNPTVIVSPEEEKITKGPPSDRRRYFDKIFSTISPQYLEVLTIYSKTVKQRNAVLKSKTYSQLDVWDLKTAFLGEKVWALKVKLIDVFRGYLKKANNLYDQKSVSISINNSNQKKKEKSLYEGLKKSFEKDRYSNRTSIGPHHDTYEFMFNSKNIKNLGSQGEHKIAFVLIKLSEHLFIEKETGKTPTFLLDDFFAKLDFKRSDAVIALMEKKAQTIITNTDLVDLEKHGVNLENPKNTSFFLER